MNLRRALPSAGLVLVLVALAGCRNAPVNPGIEVLPQVLDPLFLIPSLPERNSLQVVLDFEQDELSVGDTFSWYAKFDNPTLDEIEVEAYAEDPSQLLRFTQASTRVTNPIFGEDILRVRGGIRPRVPEPSGDLRGNHEIASQEPLVIEGSGTVVEGSGGQILLQSDQWEIILTGRGEWDVYIPFVANMFDEYLVGSHLELIREEYGSNVERITIR
jgi:hypothetical protein